MITFRQHGVTRNSYSFDISSGRSGGALYGENFFADICTYGFSDRDSTRLTQIDDSTWEISSIDSDPDFVLYLWKKSRGEPYDFYIQEHEFIFLYEFFRQNGFGMMLDDIKCIKKEDSMCVLF